MSRSQFYWHVKRGTFHAPLCLASNSRPYFTASMVEDNLRARETGIGVNGEYVIFYERQPTNTKTEGKKPKANHAALLEGLRSLGLTAVTTEQVDGALAACFPTGTAAGRSQRPATRFPAPEAFGSWLMSVWGLAGDRRKGVNVCVICSRMSGESRSKVVWNIEET